MQARNPYYTYATVNVNKFLRIDVLQKFRKSKLVERIIFCIAFSIFRLLSISHNCYSVSLWTTAICLHNQHNSSTVMHLISLNCFNCLSLVTNRSHPAKQAAASCKASIALNPLYSALICAAFFAIS